MVGATNTFHGKGLDGWSYPTHFMVKVWMVGATNTFHGKGLSYRMTITVSESCCRRLRMAWANI